MSLLAHLFQPFGVVLGPDSTIVVVFAFVIVLTIVKQISRWQRDKLYYDLAKTALEKGQPVPERPWGPGDARDMWRYSRRWNRSSATWFVPRGLILLAVSAGLYLAAPESIGRWWILPAIVGVAQLIIGGFMWMTRPRDTRDPFDPMNRPQ